jgi:putative transcription factor
MNLYYIDITFNILIMSYQDWNPVIFHKKTKKTVSDRERVRQGTAWQAIKRPGAGKNSNSGTGVYTKIQRDALNNDGEPQRIKKIDKSISRKIQQARSQQKMSRKQLAQKANEKETVIADYENGKAIPNSRLISKLERILKTKLR